MTIIVTAADIYAKADPERAYASVSRIGGDRYRVRLLIGDLEPEDFDDIDSAYARAQQLADARDADPGEIEDRVALKQQILARDRTIVEQAARIAELEASIAAQAAAAAQVDARVDEIAERIAELEAAAVDVKPSGGG